MKGYKMKSTNVAREYSKQKHRMSRIADINDTLQRVESNLLFAINVLLAGPYPDTDNDLADYNEYMRELFADKG